MGIPELEWEKMNGIVGGKKKNEWENTSGTKTAEKGTNALYTAFQSW